MFKFSRISSRIKLNEGFKDIVYKDKLGYQTIGYGHLINSKDGFILKKKYPKKLLLEVFYIDLRKAILDFKKHYNYKTLENNIQEVIIEMIFQLGIKKVVKFEKFNFYIRNRQLYLAALEMIKSRWYKQTPNRVDRLTAILLRNDKKR